MKCESFVGIRKWGVVLVRKTRYSNPKIRVSTNFFPPLCFAFDSSSICASFSLIWYFFLLLSFVLNVWLSVCFDSSKMKIF